MRCCFVALFLAACAQPVSSHVDFGKPGKHDLKGVDLAGAGEDLGSGNDLGKDLKKAPDFAEPSTDDLAGSSPDLAAKGDFATSNDLAQTPDDQATPVDQLAATDQASNGCAGQGTACPTGYPGACAAGTLTCSGGTTLVCTPNTTTQPCYSGPSGTDGHGACHGGTQSCVGTLGACTGEVTPAANENCFNSVDDDCNDKVNDTCPIAVSVGTPVALPSVGGAGGGAGSTRCPAGQFAGAVRYFYDDFDGYMAGMGLFCVTPTLTKGTASYSITTSDVNAVSPINFYGYDEDYFDDSDDCTFGGGLGTVWRHAILSVGSYVDGLESQCASGSLSLSSANKLSVNFTATGAYTGWYYASGTALVESCPSGSVLVGYDYRIGSLLDAIAAVCAPLTFSYQP